MAVVATGAGYVLLRGRQRVREMAAARNPAEVAELSDSLTTAFLLMLEELSPTERLTVLLADVFDEPFSSVAEILDKSESAVRQQAIDLVRQRVEVGEVHQADGAAADLVLVGRADAAAGGADLGARRAGGGFTGYVAPDARTVEYLMAYRGMARADAERQMRRLNAAWAVLGDPSSRRRYDAELAAAAQGGGSTTGNAATRTASGP